MVDEKLTACKECKWIADISSVLPVCAKGAEYASVFSPIEGRMIRRRVIGTTTDLCVRNPDGHCEHFELCHGLANPPAAV